MSPVSSCFTTGYLTREITVFVRMYAHKTSKKCITGIQSNQLGS